MIIFVVIISPSNTINTGKSIEKRQELNCRACYVRTFYLLMTGVIIDVGDT